MKHFLLKTMLLLCALVVGSSAWGDSFTITFKTGSGDGNAVSTSNNASLVVAEGSTGYVTGKVVTATNTYYAGTGGLKLGKSGVAGALKMNLASSIKPSSIVVNAKRYNSTKAANIQVNGKTAQSLTADFADYTFEFDGNTEVTYIQLNSTNYCWVNSVTFIYSTASLSSISITNAPTKTAYKIGETFSTAGMVVTGTYSDNSTQTITGYTMAIGETAIADGYVLSSAGNKTITISYQGKTCEQAITVAGVTGLAVKTAPTKTQYKYGETLDLTGLELTATYSDSETKDLTEGFTAAPANASALTASGNVTFTYYGQICTQAYTVGTLSSLTYNSTGDGAFANTIYTEKDHFDPTGLVVTAHYTNGISETVTGYTLNPSTTDELATTNTAVTVSYTWAETEQTVNIPITVNAGTKYTVSFDAGNGTYTGGDITETAYQGGITLPTATTSVAGWVFAGWKETSAATNTTTRPTLFAAGSTYYPTANCTLYAVYMLEDAVNKYRAATANGDIVDGLQVVISAVGTSYQKTMGNNNGTIVDIDNFTPDVNGEITCANSQALWTLSISNGNVIISNNGKSLKRSSTTLSLDNSGTNWTISKASYGTNRFLIKDASYNYYIERGSSSWVAYNTSSVTNNNTTSYIGLTIYVPVSTAYNSNPSAIITPTVEFGKSGTTLYLDAADKTYTNTASVEGVSKAITYSSSDNTIAEVDANGVVTAKKIGTATITASVEKELGVSNAAQDTYDVTVKSTTTISGIKALTSTSTSVSFTADLTDAVVTYVNGSHAYIQDASGAVYASCGTSLTAGQKINGAVSGSVKAAYQIDEITSLDVTEATVTNDGDIPAAEVKTLAQIKAGDYDGKLVTVNAVSISKPYTTTTLTDGSKIDDTEVSFTMYSPNSAASVNDQEKGNFTGFVSIYNGSTYRLNLYEQSQFVKTHNAPTAQDLTFESNAIELDEDTEAFANFTGQTVEGAEGTVIYSIDIDEETPVVTSINAETGAVVLSGAYGTATIKASAAAAEVTEAGVTTPYTATEKTYTITVYPRYTVTFSVNGVETELRQASHGAEIVVPSPAAIGDYVFKGWSTTTVDATDVAPSLTEVTNAPTANATYYAVFAIASGSPVEEHTSTFTVKQAPAPSSPYVSDGSSWTWSNVTFIDDVSAQINPNGSVIFTLPSGGKAKSLTITKTNNAWAGACSVVLKEGSNTLKTFSLGTSSSDTYNFTSTYDHAASYTLSNTTSKSAWTDHITFVYTTGGTTYSGYTTTVSKTKVTLGLNGFTTFASPYALDLTNMTASEGDVVAYKAVEKEGTYIVFRSIDQTIPANTGILLKGTAGATVEIDVVASGDDVDGNIFKVNTAGTTFSPESGYYYFGMKKATSASDDLTFALFDPDQVAIPATKAYFKLSTSLFDSSVKTLNARFEDGESTGITEVQGVNGNAEGAYDLMGRKVAQPTRGLYIVNGKKVFINK